MAELADSVVIKIPAWIRVLHRVVLHGHSDRDQAFEMSRLWSSHVQEYGKQDPISRINRAGTVILSAVTHVFWRLRYGPSTAVGAGLLIAGVGLAATLFALTDSYGFFNSYLGPAAIGMIFFGWSVARHLGPIPLLNAVAVAALAIPALLSATSYYWTEPSIFSDYFVVLAGIIGIASVLLLVGNSAAGAFFVAASGSWQNTLGKLYTSSLVVSVGLLALANAHGALVYTSPELVRASLAAFGVEGALAYWLVRNSSCLYETSDTKAMLR